MRLKTTPMLWGKWKEEAKLLPPDSPKWMQDFAQRILWLIEDVEAQERRLGEIRKLTDET
jgi:hypothetical protein